MIYTRRTEEIFFSRGHFFTFGPLRQFGKIVKWSYGFGLKDEAWGAVVILSDYSA